jgi:RNA polymerase sigma factor (sigma-70 family)
VTLAGVAPEQAQGEDDHQLVVAVRRGDDRAFEAIYGRYHRRIAAYVLGMVKDHGRAEDVTQEVFVSALRGMRKTARPIAVEPWLYGIAKNACIDEFRRSQRAQEVSIDVDEAGGLVGSAPTPDAALLAKQQLDDLRGAFGGLSDTYHEILVMRELEGLSYSEIGERMGMSRTAVESSLFRARRRLAEEYDELATGARCQRIQEVITMAVEGALGTRESHRLARHVAHCQPCRREALTAGVDSSILTYVPLRRRAARKIAALLPFPGLSRLLRGRGEELTGSPGGGLATQAPMLSEQLNAGWAKAAAVVAVLVAGATGVGTKVAVDRGDASTPESRPERARAAAEPTPAGGARLAAAQAGERSRARSTTGNRKASRTTGRTKVRDRETRGDAGAGLGGGGADRPEQSDSPAGSGGGTSRGGGQAAKDPGARSGSGSGGGGGGRTSGGGSGSSPSGPSTDAPAGSGSQPLAPVVNGVTNTVGNTVNGVNQTVQGTTQGVNQTLDGVNQTLQGSPQGLNQTVDGVNQTVQGVTGGLSQTVEGATQGLNETIGGLLRPRRP